jgi:hypothetical protein
MLHEHSQIKARTKLLELGHDLQHQTHDHGDSLTLGIDREAGNDDKLTPTREKQP